MRRNKNKREKEGIVRGLGMEGRGKGERERKEEARRVPREQWKKIKRKLEEKCEKGKRRG